MATNTTNNEMLTVTTDSAALACREACPECPDSDVYTMTHTSDAIRRHAEEHNLKVIDVPLATIDDADYDGIPECPDSDVYTMTHTSDAIRRHAEENNLKVIDVPLSTIDDADCDGLPEYDPETGVVKYTW